MSHYSVAVITKPGGKTVDELLAPYSEEIEVAPYISETKEEIIAHGKRMREEAIARYEEDDKEIGEFLKSLCDAKTDEEIYQAQISDDDVIDDDGNRLSTYNPNSKWDWYQIGGRWSGLLKLKDADKDDLGYEEALLGDIDFSPAKEEYDYHVRFWEVVVEEAPLKDGESEPFNMFKKEFYTERYKDKYDYADRTCKWGVYAVLDQNGIWHEPGEMGWFGVSTAEPDDERIYDEWLETYLEKIVEEHPDWTMTIVDCHI